MTYISYPNTVILALTSPNEYGDEEITQHSQVDAAFEWTTGTAQGNHQTLVTSDAVCFVDPSNSFVKTNLHRLEEAIVIYQSQSFKVDDAFIATTHQTSDEVDNVELRLTKTKEYDAS